MMMSSESGGRREGAAGGVVRPTRELRREVLVTGRGEGKEIDGRWQRWRCRGPKRVVMVEDQVKEEGRLIQRRVKSLIDKKRFLCSEKGGGKMAIRRDGGQKFLLKWPTTPK